MALWGDDRLSHFFTSFTSDVTSSGQPSLTSPSKLALTCHSQFPHPALSFLHSTYHCWEFYYVFVCVLIKCLLHQMSVD